LPAPAAAPVGMIHPTFAAVLFAGGLFLGMLGMQELGRRMGSRRLAENPEYARGIGPVEGALFGLLGLLLAFTFSGAVSRFDDRRLLITEEVNAIGTAWLRIDLLPANAQPNLRDLFRRYVDSRLETYRKLPDIAAAEAELAHSVALQGEIWKASVAALRLPEAQVGNVTVVNSLNEMFDVVTKRTDAARTHPPSIIYAMLAFFALVAALLAGFGMAEGQARSWLHVIGFAAVLSLTTYVILDIEYPRHGFVRVDAFDRSLVELRRSMD
jgi:hypothetical protein